MKKFLATLLCLAFAFAPMYAVAKSCFDPVDEPTAPFERVLYYMQGMKATFLPGSGESGAVYMIGRNPVSWGIIVSEGWIQQGIVQVDKTLAAKLGAEYVFTVRTPFGGGNEVVTKETAEEVANWMFALAEEDGVWFRKGYVLYWKPDLGYFGGW